MEEHLEMQQVQSGNGTIKNAMENTATNRQRFALWCITKKDYRNEVISKEEAARLIQELGDPNYKKASKKSLARQLEDYMVEHFEEIWKACGESLKVKSIVEDDPTYTKSPKRYAFIGFGCGITYFTYRKNNMKAKEIADAGKDLIHGKAEDMFVRRFTADERRYYDSIGCPLRAIYSQDQHIQQCCYGLVTRFAETVGVTLDYVSRLD